MPLIWLCYWGWIGIDLCSDWNGGKGWKMKGCVSVSLLKLFGVAVLLWQ